MNTSLTKQTQAFIRRGAWTWDSTDRVWVLQAESDSTPQDYADTTMELDALVAKAKALTGAQYYYDPGTDAHIVTWGVVRLTFEWHVVT